MTLRTLLVPITDKTGLDALLKTAFGAATKNCSSCHEGYRVKKE